MKMNFVIFRIPEIFISIFPKKMLKNAQKNQKNAKKIGKNAEKSVINMY